MKKVLTIPLLMVLFLSFSSGTGCRKDEKPAPKPPQAPTPVKSTYSPNWKSMGTVKQGDLYLDFESVTYDGPIVAFRYMQVDREGEVDVARCSINCKQGTIVFMEQQESDVNRIPLKTAGNESIHWIKIQPNSVWVSFQKSLCKEFAQGGETQPEKKALLVAGKKTTETAQLKVKTPKKAPVPGSARKLEKFTQVDEKPVQEKALPGEERKTKEVARLKVKPLEKTAVPDSEREIYYRYKEVTGMPPGAAGGLIHTGRESRAWYEGSKISSPLTEKELLAIENNLAKAEVHNACIIANSIFSDDPVKTITKKDLKEKGFIPSEDIELAIYNGARTSLKIAARHNKGTKIYMADRNCNITEETQH
jgi:hypothetical protein